MNNLVEGICPPNLTSLGERSFQHSMNMRFCVIPSGVKVASSYTFYRDISGVRTRSLWFPTTPPTINSNTLRNRDGNTIYVPDASVADYKAAQYWSSYASSIYGFSQLAIDYPDYYERYIHIYD